MMMAFLCKHTKLHDSAAALSANRHWLCGWTGRKVLGRMGEWTSEIEPKSKNGQKRIANSITFLNCITFHNLCLYVSEWIAFWSQRSAMIMWSSLFRGNSSTSTIWTFHFHVIIFHISGKVRSSTTSPTLTKKYVCMSWWCGMDV